jgi:hypothetical protein
MASTIDEINAPGKVIYELIVEAQNAATGDRREGVRLAFFRPVEVRFEDGRCVSAFSREISAGGIGLVHNVEVPVGEVELCVSGELGYSIRVRTEIVWCQACSDRWYISGGRFVGPAKVGS